MLPARVLGCTFALLITLPAAYPLFAQSAINKPVRIVTSASGSGADLVARLIAQSLSANLGQQTIVDNRAGSGIIAAQAVAKAEPDGATLLVYGGNIWLLPFLQDNVPYDPLRDFAAVTLAASSPNILVVNTSLQVNSVRDLIALARAKPGELNYAAGITASTPHLAAELFKSMAKISIVQVPYKGTAPALTDLIGGRVQLMFPVAASGMPHVKSGKLKALAVTSREPTPLAPDLPTMNGSGLPGYETVLTLGVYAPAKTSPAVLSRLNREIIGTLNGRDLREKLFSAGAEAVGSSPEELMNAVKADMAKWGKIIKEAGIRTEYLSARHLFDLPTHS